MTGYYSTNDGGDQPWGLVYLAPSGLRAFRYIPNRDAWLQSWSDTDYFVGKELGARPIDETLAFELVLSNDLRRLGDEAVRAHSMGRDARFVTKVDGRWLVTRETRELGPVDFKELMDRVANGDMTAIECGEVLVAHIVRVPYEPRTDDDVAELIRRDANGEVDSFERGGIDELYLAYHTGRVSTSDLTAISRALERGLSGD